MSHERAHKAELVAVAQRLHARGWVANHDGNVSARAGAGRFVATPGAVSKAAVTVDSLIVVDDQGQKLGGGGKPFGELGLHLTVYARRLDAQAVVHAHPPYATALACAGARHLERPFMAEAVVSLGPSIPTVPFAAPGRDACAALAPFLAAHDAVLLASHGVLAWGDDPWQAYLRLELVEHLARIALEADKLGGVKPLPDAVLATLLEARRKAGLGPEARGGAAAGAAAAAVASSSPTATRVVACAPSPTADVVLVPPGRGKPRGADPGAPAGDLAAIIREELVRALRGS